ncbi:MAG: hypothetical protein M0Q26_11945 [Chitinophagaceae bacterium]|nr:hypothetical protein [Chitinophagaceae bacterium]
MTDNSFKIPKHFLFMLNQLFEMEQKVAKVQEQNSIQRNIDRLKGFFETEALTENQGLVYYNPIGESFDETRTDCEATISGGSHENLKIIEVIRPIIYLKYGNTQLIAQKGIVIVNSGNKV